MENRAVFVRANDDLRKFLDGDACPVGSRTMIQALDNAPADADTLIIDYFPDLLEHMELITRISDAKLKRIIFRQASRTHGYFPLEQRPRAPRHLPRHRHLGLLV
jgi:hypothetical protein